MARKSETALSRNNFAIKLSEKTSYSMDEVQIPTYQICFDKQNDYKGTVDIRFEQSISWTIRQ